MIGFGADEKWNTALERAILAAATPAVLAVGISRDAAYPDGTKVETVAFRQEFGDGRIPPRPFMRNAMAEREGEWRDLVRDAYRDIVRPDGFTPREALELVGEFVKSDIVESLDALTQPPLSPRTVAAKERKGRRNPDKPLVDSGLLRSSISVEVTV